MYHKKSRGKEKKSMALTAMEKQVLRQMLKYYSGEVPGLPINETMINNIIDSDEAGKKTLVKDYLATIVLPQMQTNLIQIQNTATDVQNKINDIKAYAKAETS